MSKRHPSDVIAEGESIVNAAGRFAAWKSHRDTAIDALILTYDDDDAKRLLEILREEFWSA